jgi:hypothetical protein
MPLWELGLTQRSKQQFWSDCSEWFSLTFTADLWNVFMRFVTFCAYLISSKPILSLRNLICRDDNLTTIVDSFRQGFLAESRRNHIVELVGSTEKHTIFYIFYISFNLLFPCIILRKLISSCVELDKITCQSPFLPYLPLLSVVFCSSPLWFDFPVESTFRW